jgi:protein involved in polysaccharide export with SLBB domain
MQSLNPITMSLAGISMRALRECVLSMVVCLALLQGAGNAAAQTGAPAATEPAANPGGPVRLRQPVQPVGELPRNAPASERTPEPLPPYQPGEFERFVQRQAGPVEIRRFGADLVARGFDTSIPDASPPIPPDYPVATGDEVLVTLWGSVDADLRLIVDRTGRINIPRVGAISVAGVRYADLADVISQRVAQVFKNFQLSVSLGALRGIRVFVTGFAASPGAYTVSSLSTVTSALFRAGGPSSAGSYRSIELRRGAQLVVTFDLYELVLKGDRSADRPLQAGDVIHVPPVGNEVGLIGSVNKPAVLELKAGETVADALRMGGGFTAVADRSRLAVERLKDRNAARIRELALPADLTATLSYGDVLRAFSSVDSALPTQVQSKRVRIEGEVARPGEYVLPPSSSVADAVRAAGGLTAMAYVFGTEFNRESVRATQQVNYDRALRDLETDFARATATQRVSSADEAAAQTSRGSANARLIERLRTTKPSGRVVLQLERGARDLPDLALEDGDRIFVPPVPTSVGVFGSVFNGNNYLFAGSRTVGDYVQLAGGPTRGADDDSTFVIRANGAVVGGLQSARWLGANPLVALPAEPGDTIFVPERLDKTTFLQNAKDWTQILAQFALGAAALKTLGN